jgi:hypothetical protein
MLYQLSYTREPCALRLHFRGPDRDPAHCMVGEGFEPS